MVSKKTEDAAKEAYARRRADNRRKLSVFKKDLKPFLTRFDKAYSALYSSKDLQDTRNGPEIYNRLVDRGDKLIKAHPQEVAEFNRTRGDKLSSDREVAAFACAWDHVRITEPKGIKKKTPATSQKASKKATGLSSRRIAAWARGLPGHPTVTTDRVYNTEGSPNSYTVDYTFGRVIGTLSIFPTAKPYEWKVALNVYLNNSTKLHSSSWRTVETDDIRGELLKASIATDNIARESGNK